MLVPLKLDRYALVALLMVIASSAIAIEPESGIYWSTSRPGEGLLIERQGPNVGLVLYTYDADGEPEFYVAGGALEEGGFTEPVGWTAGYLPLHKVRATLFRTTDGPRFNSVDLFTSENGREYISTAVGVIEATFQYDNYAEVIIALDEFPVGGHPTQRQITSFGYSRTNFGFSSFGTSVFSGSTDFPVACWNDLSGLWVFVDMVSRGGEPLRFDFALEEVSPPSEEMRCAPQVGESHVLVYVDSSRDVTMRCVNSPTGDPDGGRRHIPGCEVTRNASGEALFYFYQQDIGLKRMVGSRGAYPSADSGILRTQDRIIGIRVD